MVMARRLWFAALLAAACAGEATPARDASDLDAPVSDAGSSSDNGDAGSRLPELTPCRAGDPQPCPPPDYPTWPMPAPPGVPLPHTADYTASAETVRDGVTALEWQRSFFEKQTWQQAKETCADLVIGGLSDWRLPSRIELVSLIDYTRLPAIDQAAFPDTVDDYFWSASRRASDPELGYSVYFGAGLTAYGAITGASGYVRCVRGGGAGAQPRFETLGEVVRDRNTGLQWQRQISADRLTWETAIDFCQQSGWRLPTTKELQTIVDETRVAPLIDPAVFPGTPAAIFWTSTAVNKAGVSNAVYVDFRDGGTEEAAMLDAHRVRCVR